MIGVGMQQRRTTREVTSGRRRYRRVPAAALLAMAALGCSATPDTPPPAAAINHIVLFQLLDTADAEELIRDCHAMAGQIPGLTSYAAGRRGDFGRGPVTSTFDVGLLIGFASSDDYHAYLVHPAHEAIVRKWQPRLQHIQIHDVVSERDGPGD